MKSFLSRCLFSFLLFVCLQSSAQPVITGSDTVCAGLRYGYKVVMPGAVTFNWTLPNGWYFLYGQGTDSVFVTCNVNVGYVVVVGFDSAAVPIGTDSIEVHWGLGGDVWHLQGTQTWILPCYCSSYWTFEIIVDTLLCQGGCGDAVQNPYLYAALFNGPIPSYANYLGPLDSTTAVAGPATVYGYFIDTTFGLANLIVISGGICGSGNNGFTIPSDPPCWMQVSLWQNPDPICVGDTFTVSVGWWNISTYYWSTSSPYISFIGPTNGPTVTVVLTAASWATIDFWGSDWNGCYSYFGSLTVNYTNCGPPIVSFYTNPTTDCAGSCHTFYNNTQYATSYQWSFPGGNPSSSALANPTVCYPTAGQYSVTLTAFNAYGSAVLTQTNYITINPSPIVTVSPTSVSICQAQYATLTATGANTYTWSPAWTLSSSTGPIVTASPNTTTTYTVIGSQNGCTGSSQVTVMVNPVPVMTVTPSQTICAGQQVTLTVSGANTYYWSPSSSLSSSTASSVIANPSSTTTYFVTGTSNNGCTATSITTVAVNPLPVVSVNPSMSLCNGQSAALTATGASTYSWSPSASLSASTGANVTATPSSTTTYTVIGNLLGCTASSQVTVTVLPVPAVTVSPSVTICKDDSTLLAASGASTYTWNPAISLSSSIGASVVANPVSTTTYTVTGTGINGCTATASTTITVNLPPNISVSNSSPVCIGSPVSLSAAGASSYIWQPGNMTGPSVVVNPAVTTTFTVTGTASNGCTAFATTVVTINPLPLVTVDLSPIDTQCTFVSSVFLSGGSPAGGTYSGIAVTGNYFYPWSSGTGTHQITYTYTDINGCTNTAMATIHVDICTGISSVDFDSAIEIYPNPGNGEFNIRVISEKIKSISLMIFNINGKMVFEMPALKKTGSLFHSVIDLGDEAEGIYYLQLTSGNEIITRKVIIEK